jgi:hypothetical protein
MGRHAWPATWTLIPEEDGGNFGPSALEFASAWTICTATTSSSTTGARITSGVIDGVGFTGRGCAISQASASLLTDEIKGKAVDTAQAMTSGDVLELLGIEISPARMKCALLSLETMHGALDGDAKAAAGASAEAQA